MLKFCEEFKWEPNQLIDDTNTIFIIGGYVDL